MSVCQTFGSEKTTSNRLRWNEACVFSSRVVLFDSSHLILTQFFSLSSDLGSRLSNPGTAANQRFGGSPSEEAVRSRTVDVTGRNRPWLFLTQSVSSAARLVDKHFPQNPDFGSSNETHSSHEIQTKERFSRSRKENEKKRKTRSEELVLPEDPLDSMFH
jgi:hypothetical protein